MRSLVRFLFVKKKTPSVLWLCISILSVAQAGVDIGAWESCGGILGEVLGNTGCSKLTALDMSVLEIPQVQCPPQP